MSRSSDLILGFNDLMAKLSQKSLLGRIEKELEHNSLIKSGDDIIVAVSGGPDSICLFDLLFELRKKLNYSLAVCHFNHRLRGRESEADKKFVKKICFERGIECLIGEAPGENIYQSEESAREARYLFFEKILSQRRGAKIALAHNLNDLSETFFLRLIRGSGLKGLLSIPLRRKNFIRPLLYFPRSEIETYLKERGLEFRCDKSNQDTRFDRNFLRLEIWPRLLKINPNLSQTLRSTIKVLEAEYDYLEGEAKLAYDQVHLEENAGSIILDQKSFILLHPAIQRLVLRKAVEKKSNLTDLTVKQLEEARAVIIKGVGKKFKLLPHSLRIELNAGKIILFRDGDERKNNG